ncbi:hypothetical protein KSX62_22415 [Enterobacter hormaechei]|uniref:hypothetical protein n=1 Tax=Enterobacteriaceae TaxID=543 RepID=UPI0013824072|nr:MULTISPECIES: hypothetical protein [Enterobacteriaceae]EBU7225585.1 hypothetical protein [Salmonella enterica subsp. enterica serovar Enteritidis]MBU8927976.1 hypothetical protein [Enterobacter hormaechei]MBU8932335.1 hypothetical protein [Enterobacter hormaechei]MBU8939326.1 hypothetical protein [Enterobacter hormaechei]MBU8948922.1 hypothetical protein [Enterobacter hormaechei]
MKKPSRTTASITTEKKKMLSDTAIRVSASTGVQVTWTDLLNYVIENYTNLAEKKLTKELKKDGDV